MKDLEGNKNMFKLGYRIIHQIDIRSAVLEAKKHNFNSSYQKILDKYLSSGKIFLTWDIRKNYTYAANELIEDQWEFVKKNKDFVKKFILVDLVEFMGICKIAQIN